MNDPQNSDPLLLLRRAVQEQHPGAAELADWSTGRLSASGHARVEAHLALCPACRHWAELMPPAPPVCRIHVLRPGGEPCHGIPRAWAAETAAPRLTPCSTGDGRFTATFVCTGEKGRVYLRAGREELAFARVSFGLGGREWEAVLSDGAAEVVLESAAQTAPAFSGFTVKEPFALTPIEQKPLRTESAVLGVTALTEPHGGAVFTALTAAGALRVASASGEEEIAAPEVPVMAVVSASLRRVLYVAGGQVRLADLSPGAVAGNVRTVADVTCLAWCPRHEIAAAGTAGGRILSWSLRTGNTLLDQETGAAVHSIALSPDGTRVAAATDDGVLFAGAAPWREPGSTSVTALGFSATGRVLAAADRDGGLTLFETATGRRIGTAPACDAPPAALAFDASGRIHLATLQHSNAL